MNIGILTYHCSHNYGAFLQAYSLSHKLNNLPGISCEIINYNLKKENNVYKRKRWKRPIYFPFFLQQDRMFEREQHSQLLSGPLVLDDDYDSILHMADERYDVIVVGSDEVWRIASRGFPNAYWLPGKHSFIKMSYAASGRNPQSKITHDVQKLMRSMYSDFVYLGVRDKITQEQTQSFVDDIKVERNCDPVFFYDRFKNKKELRPEICERWKLDPKKRIIAVFYDRPEVITKLKRILGKEYQFICITRPMWNADKNLCSINPFEWVNFIGGCDFLVTSYFHGMLFAVNQNTPFVVIDRRATRDNLETSKLYDFLHYSGLDNRYNLSSEMSDIRWKFIADTIKNESFLSINFTQVVENQKALFSSFERKLRSIKNEREN